MTLNLGIFARNMEVTKRINDYVTKKMAKFHRFMSDIDEVKVDLDYVKSARNSADRQVAQITLHGKKFTLRTEERSDDIFAAIDAATEKMQRQIERYKGKRVRGRGDGTPASEVAKEVVEPEEIDETPVIARRKQFTLVPMDELEAIEQMNMLGQDSFFVFYNANSNAINVLYRRRDGTYGLIEPTLG